MPFNRSITHISNNFLFKCIMLAVFTKTTLLRSKFVPSTLAFTISSSTNKAILHQRNTITQSVTQRSLITITNSRIHHQQRPRKVTNRYMSTEEEVDPVDIPGTDLRVLKYPHPSLRKPNQEITEEELKSGSINQLSKEMFLVMYATKGVGLAAPQVGINKKLMVYNESGDSKKWLSEVTLVNPKIVDSSDGTDVEIEGCLSFPGMNGNVERKKWIKVEAMNLKGKKIKKKFVGWEARIFQHEYDHLDGIVYPDRMTEDEKKLVQPRLDELVAQFGEGGVL